MKSFKLVRDKIPEIIKKDGKDPVFYVADKQQFYNILKDKLQEEVYEFLENDSSEELCDILEVIYAICATKKISLHELEQKRLKKAKQRGAFNKKLILELTK